MKVQQGKTYTTVDGEYVYIPHIPSHVHESFAMPRQGKSFLLLGLVRLDGEAFSAEHVFYDAEGLAHGEYGERLAESGYDLVDPAAREREKLLGYIPWELVGTALYIGWDGRCNVYYRAHEKSTLSMDVAASNCLSTLVQRGMADMLPFSTGHSFSYREVEAAKEKKHG